MRTSRPSIAELRAATQPPSIFERNSGEHWAGRLYVRRFSPYLTRLLVPTPITPNGVTWLMVLSGLGAAAAVAFDGVLTAVAAVLLIQLQILLDCSDGELARWRGQSSAVGIYLDRFAHWVTEAALPIALGIRVDEPVLGLVVAVLVLFVKGETALVFVARTESGLDRVQDTVAVAAPRGGALAALRRFAGHLPFYRAFVAIEFTALVLVASILDVERELLIALVPVAAITAVGHLLGVLTSKRLQ